MPSPSSFSPDYDHHHHGGTRAVPPKPNQKVLSLILKVVIMALITTLFFLFLGVAAILLLLATAALHRHSTSTSTNSAVPSNGLSPTDLKKLSQFRFLKRSKLDAEADDHECVVCLDVIRHGQSCRKLVDCGHMFHRKCVDAWLVKVSACPICRTPVRVNGATVLGDDKYFLRFDRRSEFSTRVW